MSPTAAALASHFLCQPIRPMWSHTAFLAPAGLLAQPSWSASHQAQPLQARVQSGPASDTLTFLWKLFERSHDPRRRSSLIQQIGRTQGSFALLETLASHRLGEDELLALIEALAQHPDPRQLPLLQSLYKRHWSQPRYQQAVLLAAGRTRSDLGLHFLKEIYASAWHRPDYRQTVIRALGFHGSAESIAKLVRISRQYERDLHVQRAVIRSLGYSHSPSSAQVLKQMLQRYPQADMRALTWRALAATASDTAVEILRQCLKQADNAKERQALQTALKRAYRD